MKSRWIYIGRNRLNQNCYRASKLCGRFGAFKWTIHNQSENHVQSIQFVLGMFFPTNIYNVVPHQLCLLVYNPRKTIDIPYVLVKLKLFAPT